MFTAGSDADSKYPTGLNIKGTNRITFFPINAYKTYVRCYLVTAKTYPKECDRDFNADYASSWANDGYPGTFEINDAKAAGFSTPAAKQNYFTLPWVPISENKELLLNWNIRKWKTLVIKPGSPPKTIMFKIKGRRFKYEDLNYAGLGAPAFVLKKQRFLVIETVAENVMFDYTDASRIDSNVILTPAKSQVGYRILQEYVYRPEWFNQPTVNSYYQNSYLNQATSQTNPEIMLHPPPTFGIHPNTTNHPLQQNVVGASTRSFWNLANPGPHFTNFIADPVWAPNAFNAPAVANFDDATYNTFGTVASGIGIRSNAT